MSKHNSQYKSNPQEMSFVPKSKQVKPAGTIASSSDVDSRTIIIIDDTPPGSPVTTYEKTQEDEDRDKRAKEIHITTSIPKGKSNTAHNKVDESSRKITVTLDDERSKKLKRDVPSAKPAIRKSVSPVTRWKRADRLSPAAHNRDLSRDMIYRPAYRYKRYSRSPPIYRQSPSPRYRRSPSPYYRRRSRSPSPLYSRHPSPRYIDRSLSPRHRRLSRSISPRYRQSPSPLYLRHSRSPSPRYRQKRSPSPRYRQKRSPSPRYRQKRSPSPRYRQKQSPSPRFRSRSPLPRFRSRSLSRRRCYSRSPSVPYRRPRSTHSPSPNYKRPRLPSPFLRHPVPSPESNNHHGRSPTTQSPSRTNASIESTNYRLLHIKENQESTTKAFGTEPVTTNKHITSVNLSDKASSSPGSNLPVLVKPIITPVLVQPLLVNKTPPVKPVHIQRVVEPVPVQSAYGPKSNQQVPNPTSSHTIPDYIALINGTDTTPRPIAEKYTVNLPPSIENNVQYIVPPAIRDKKISLTDYTETCAFKTNSTVRQEKDSVLYKVKDKHTSETSVRTNTLIKVEKATLEDVEKDKSANKSILVAKDNVEPVRMNTPSAVETLKPAEYETQPSLKINDTCTLSPPASLQSEPTHSISDGLYTVKKKRSRLLPSWKVKMSDEGDIYYYNTITGETTVTRPVA